MCIAEGVAICQFTAVDLQQLKKLAELYTQAKGLILYSEEIDPESRSNLQVIKELRDANDHLMRVVAARLADNPPGGAKDAGDEYCYSNLDKAVGHVYRAAFDALDGTILSLREKVAAILKAYPPDVIKTVIPEYWTIRTSLDDLTTRIANNRATKDVGADICTTLEQYVADTELIKGFYSRLLSAGPSLDACMDHHAREAKKERGKDFWVHVKAGIVYSALIGVGAFAGKYLLHAPSIYKDVEAQPQLMQQEDLTSGSGIAPPHIPEKAIRLHEGKK